MPNQQSLVYLPFKTSVNVHGFVNAGFQQRVTLTGENGNQIAQWVGSGEGDAPIGQLSFNTPASGRYPTGYQVMAQVDSYQNQNWIPSAIAQSAQPCTVWYYNLILLVSEDYLDQDWNDTAITFTWWVAPALRAVPEGTGKPGAVTIT